jgi:MFS family permease
VTKVQSIGRALRHRNFRLFFSGQILSLVGSWLTTVATSWLVYKLCRDQGAGTAAYVLGLVGFASQLPIFLVTPFAGVWMDRVNRHHVLMVTQTLSMLQSFVLAFLDLSHVITIPHIIALQIFQGLVNAVDMPARQSFIVEMVDDRRDLSNAIALNSSMVHTARMLGPSIAGFLIYTVGEGYCFLIDGFSYFFVLIALSFVKVKPRDVLVHKSAWYELREGLQYAFSSPIIRSLLFLVAVASLMFSSQSVLMPIVADKVLGGNEQTLGFLLGSSGLGALMGALYLASRESVRGLSRVIFRAALTLGVGLCCFCFSRALPLSMLVLLFTGGATVLLLASSNTVLQTIVDEDKRGRVMSLFSLAFMGMAPFGSLLSGVLAGELGASYTFGVCGAICLISTLIFGRSLPKIRAHMRPIYQQKGIIPLPEVEQ